ncbi:unnamed protein product [marine sediment metagenome]|uniref:Uncharacterized protein n=1 Tax=marine sediment metagenome TaxID=412755 RepID=X0WEH1_9ZZZZ
MSDEPLYRQWRAEWQRQFALGERLEALAAKHPELPFVVNLGQGLAWVVLGETLPEFAGRVKLASSFLGSPDSVSEYVFGNGLPDLRATWKVDGMEIRVTSGSTEGCRLDPRHPGKVEIENARIHPACRAALQEIEDYEPAAAGEREGG